MKFRNYIFGFFTSYISIGLSFGQVSDSLNRQVLSFPEYLGLVKTYHPTIKQANLRLTMAEGNLLKSRGAFDPYFSSNLERKDFKGSEYYDNLNAVFAIPTWFGVELKSSYENNSGEFLNPQNTTPLDGLYNIGVSVPLGRDLLINERMANLKKAKAFMLETEANRRLIVNDILSNASEAYFRWSEAKIKEAVYQRAYENALERANAVARTILQGQEAAIDSVEANILVQSRKLDLENASLKANKARLVVSNFLWLENIPLEINSNAIPVLPEDDEIAAFLNLDMTTDLNNHPKIVALENKLKGLEVDVDLARNNLLPRVELGYNFLSEDVNNLDNFNTENYKAMLNIKFPLFLRKERGELKLSKAYFENAQLDFVNESLILRNKIEAALLEIESYTSQSEIISQMVRKFDTMLSAEERKFEAGESSIFLINFREQKLLESQIKEIDLKVQELESYLGLFNVLGISDLAE
ncbi:MAG: TolC family protein [Flavobacteriaceae bacterium]|nr:TolC family protein [Flavobacteriaceae bacterium]